MWRAPPWGPSEERMRAMSRSLSRRRRLNRRSPNARGGGGGKGRGGGGGARSAAARASLQRLRRRHAQHSRRRKGVRGASGHRPSARRRSPKAKHRGGGGSGGGGGAGGGAWVATSRGSARAPQSPRMRGSSLRRRPPPGARCGRGRSSRSRRRGKSRHKSHSRRHVRSRHMRQSHMGSARSLPSLVRSMSRSRLKSVRGSMRRLSPPRSPSPGCGGSPTTRSASSTRGGSPGRRTSRQRHHSVSRLISPRYKNRRGRSPGRRRHYARLRGSQSRRRRRAVSRSHTSSASHSTSPSPTGASPTSAPAALPTGATAPADATENDNINNIENINNSGGDSLENDPDKENRDCLNSLAGSSPSLLFRTFRRPMCPGERPGSPITAVASLQSIMETQKRASQAFILPARSATNLPCIALPAPPPARSQQMPHTAGQAFIPMPPPSPPLPQDGPSPQMMASQLQQMTSQQMMQLDQQEQMQQQLGGTVTVQHVIPSRGSGSSRERPSRQPSVQSIPTQRPSGYQPITKSTYATHPYIAGMQLGPQPRAESPPAQKGRGSDVILKASPTRLKGGRTSETILDGTPVYERELFYGDDSITQPCVPSPGMIVHPPQTPSNRIHPHGAGFYFGPPAPPQVSPEALAAAKAHAARIAAARAEALRKMADVERERELATPPTTSSSTVTGSTCRHLNAISRGRRIQRPCANSVHLGNRPINGRPPGLIRAPRPQTAKLQNPLLIGTANPKHPDPVMDRRSPNSQPMYPSTHLGTAHPMYSMAVASTWHLDSAKATAQRSLAALSSPPPPPPPHVPPVAAKDSSSYIERATVSSRSKASHTSRLKRHNKAQVSSSANMAPSKPASRQKGRRKESTASGHPHPRDQGQAITTGKNTSKHNQATKKRSEAMKFSGDHPTGKGFNTPKQWGQAQRDPQVVFEHKGSVWTQWTTPTQATLVPNDSSPARRPYLGRIINQPPTLRPVVAEPMPRSTPLHWLPSPRQSPSTHRLPKSPTTSASSTDNRKLATSDTAPGGGDALWRTYYYEEQLFTPTIPLPTHYG